MDKRLRRYSVYMIWLLLTPIYFWLSHYLAVFPHEYLHSICCNSIWV